MYYFKALLKILLLNSKNHVRRLRLLSQFSVEETKVRGINALNRSFNTSSIKDCAHPLLSEPLFYMKA